MDPRTIFRQNSMYQESDVADRLVNAGLIDNREEATKLVASSLKSGELQRGTSGNLTWQSCQRLEDRLRAEAAARSRENYDRKDAARREAAERSAAARQRDFERRLVAAERAKKREEALNRFADEKLLTDSGGSRKR